MILDDIGYVQQSRDEMEVLFTFLAERYERRSVIITSNLVFSEWDRIFKDPMTTAAAIDRLVHHAVILEMTGSSIRFEEAQAGRNPEGGNDPTASTTTTTNPSALTASTAPTAPGSIPTTTTATTTTRRSATTTTSPASTSSPATGHPIPSTALTAAGSTTSPTEHNEETAADDRRAQIKQRVLHQQERRRMARCSCR